MRFKNPRGGSIVEIKRANLNALLWGPIYFAKHKAWLHTVISAVLAIVTYGISVIVYAFFGERIIRNAYLQQGWIEVGEGESDPAASDFDTVAQFDKLIKSKNKGLITEEEFIKQKNEIFHITETAARTQINPQQAISPTPSPVEDSNDIPKDVRYEVWQRDLGKCAQCGSNEDLEFYHIVSLSEGGLNTAGNVQLLCEKCYREKSNKVN